MSLRIEPESSTKPSLVRRWISPITVSLLLVAVTTALLWVIQPRLEQDHLIFIYFVPTTLIAIRYGSLSAMGVIIASSLAAVYFLYPPQLSFVLTWLQFIEVLLFSMLALLASQVVSGFAKDGRVVKRRLQIAMPPLDPKRSGLNHMLSRFRAKIALF
jgi:K+-sensing histidine kinase KdpD